MRSDRKAGLTSISNFCEVSIPLKYFWTKLGLMPTSKLKRPIGYLPKLTSMLKLNEVVVMYEATIPVDPLSPEAIRALRTLLHLLTQSVAD